MEVNSKKNHNTQNLKNRNINPLLYITISPKTILNYDKAFIHKNVCFFNYSEVKNASKSFLITCLCLSIFFRIFIIK